MYWVGASTDAAQVARLLAVQVVLHRARVGLGGVQVCDTQFVLYRPKWAVGESRVVRGRLAPILAVIAIASLSVVVMPLV